MIKTFTIPYKDDINKIYNFGLQQSKRYKGIFSGNTKSGNFNFDTAIGKFTGNYIVYRDTIQIMFLKKPFLVPNSLIEKILREHIR